MLTGVLVKCSNNKVMKNICKWSGKPTSLSVKCLTQEVIFPDPTTDPKLSIQCPWGLRGCTLGGKGQATQLCKVLEVFCRRSLSHAAGLSTFMHHTHSSTDWVLSYKAGLWVSQEHQKQPKYDLPKVVHFKLWIQVSELHADAWSPQPVAADLCYRGGQHEWGQHKASFALHVQLPQSPTWWGLGPYTGTQSLGFCSLSASSFSL